MEQKSGLHFAKEINGSGKPDEDRQRLSSVPFVEPNNKPYRTIAYGVAVLAVVTSVIAFVMLLKPEGSGKDFHMVVDCKSLSNFETGILMGMVAFSILFVMIRNQEPGSCGVNPQNGICPCLFSRGRNGSLGCCGKKILGAEIAA